MTSFFLLHAVVASLAIREALSPFLPLRRARILRIVPSLGSRMIHVRLPARCVPMVSLLSRGSGWHWHPAGTLPKPHLNGFW
jgi:hypothetical protein